MLQFLMVAAVMFGLCWVWVGGYLADFVIWVISKLTPNSANEQGLAGVVGAVFLALGIIVALATRNGNVGPTFGGAIAGAGLYIAVRLPSKIRKNRLKRLANGAARDLSGSLSSTEVIGSAEPHIYGETHSGRDDSSQRDEAWVDVHDSNNSIEVARTAQDADPVVERTQESVFVTRVASAAGVVHSGSDQERVAAWAEVHDAATPSERLAEIVGLHPEFAPAIAAHPNCYPELMAWMRDTDLVAGAPDATAVPPVAVPPVTDTTMTVEATVSAPRRDMPVTPEPAAWSFTQPSPQAGANLVAAASGTGAKRARRWVIPVVGAVAALLVLGAVFLLMSRGGTPTAASAPSSTYPSAMSSPPSATSSPTLSSEPPSVSPESDEVLSYTCWNGKDVDSLERCSQPSGIEGLKYIYPSMNDQWSHCTYAAYRPTTATYDCRFTEGVIRYRYWRDPAEADRHYRQKYATGERSDFVLDDNNVGTLYRATRRDKDGNFTMTARWGSGHYSLSVDSKTRPGQDALWATVRFRALSDLRGHLSENEPGEAERE